MRPNSVTLQRGREPTVDRAAQQALDPVLATQNQEDGEVDDGCDSADNRRPDRALAELVERGCVCQAVSSDGQPEGDEDVCVDDCRPHDGRESQVPLEQYVATVSHACSLVVDEGEVLREAKSD